MVPHSIQQRIEKNNIPQRILLSGSGDNKSIGIAIASLLQDTPPDRIERGLHPDTLVFPDTGKSFKIDWSDAAKKDNQDEHENVRGLIRWAHQKPALGRYRVVVFENLERLTDVAPHACLKLIEEPPQKTVFIFTTQNHHHRKLLDTIISRLTLFRISHGNTFALQYEDEINTFLNHTSLIHKFKLIESLDKDSKSKSDRIDRSEIKTFLTDVMHILRDKQTHHTSLEDVFEAYEAIEKNIHPRLVLERLALRMHLRHKGL